MDCDFAVLLGNRASEELEQIIKDYEYVAKRFIRRQQLETIRKLRKLIQRRVHGKC